MLLQLEEGGNLSSNIVAEAIAGAINSPLHGAISEGQARQTLVNAFGQEKLEAFGITDPGVLLSFTGAIREPGGGGREGPTQADDFIEAVYADTARFRGVLDTPPASATKSSRQPSCASMPKPN